MAFQTKEAQAKNFVANVVPDASKCRVEIEEFISDNIMTNLFLLALEDLQKEDPNRSQAISDKMHDIANQFTQEPDKSLYLKAAERFRFPYWDPCMPRNNVTNNADTPDEKIWGIPKILSVPEVWIRRPNSAVLIKIVNPLHWLKFQNDALDKKARVPIVYLPKWNMSPLGRDHTIRSADESGETNPEILELNMQRQAISIGTNLWKLLSRYAHDNDRNNELRSWASFASHNIIDSATGLPIKDPDGELAYQDDTSVSLESWHDNIHLLVGTGNHWVGHMGNPIIAGFDPIFWLHHCNVDRILAIYQALYPDKWTDATDSKTYLYPFKKNDTEFWVSNEVRDWTTLGYGIPGTKLLDPNGVHALEKHLYEYYSWTTDGSLPPESVSAYWPKDLSTSVALNGPKARHVDIPVVQFEALDGSKLITRTIAVQTAEDMDIQIDEDLRHIIIENPAANPVVNPPETVKKDKSVLTWNARVRVKKFAYDGSFNIHVFIGEIDESQTHKFLVKKNQVGFSGVFATSSDAPCANCVQQRQDGMMYEDNIPLSNSLKAYLKSNTTPESEGPPLALRTLEDFEPANVVPFLKKNMAWTLTDAASNLLDDRQQLIDSKLEITVSVRQFDLPSPQFPMGVYYPSTDYKEATVDKVGGFGWVDE
ncbi:hypothetical protein G7Y89_g11303 [Cudoniella acicularis]|uniref:tyrosinase n=1 Tax=Cudoniella acicularis TaxID=354080 RepID=A0A8H4RB41_9HELO|nr:hypothetical protein G7Y89_g11303 [Cudoniella acicularis]